MECYTEGNFILHSGEKSNYLFDVLKLINNGEFIQNVWDFLEKDSPLVGIEFGGAILASIVFIDDFSIIRKDGTIYGEIPNNYTLFDDVVTTENSIKTAIEQIGKEPKKIKCVVDRRKTETLKIESMLKWKQ